jgi:hypothetical protein
VRQSAGVEDALKLFVVGATNFKIACMMLLRVRVSMAGFIQLTSAAPALDWLVLRTLYNSAATGCRVSMLQRKVWCSRHCC